MDEASSVQAEVCRTGDVPSTKSDLCKRTRPRGVQQENDCEQSESDFQNSKISNKDSVTVERPPLIVYPHVDCPEKIIICLDLNEEMSSTKFSSRSGDKFTSLELALRSLRMFVVHKSQMNPKHEFSLLVFQDESKMIHQATKKTKDILNVFDDKDIVTEPSEPLNLAHMFQTIKESVELPCVDKRPDVIAPPYIVRLLLVYGRSQSVPRGGNSDVQKELESSPYFFTDVLYIHEPPSNENKCEEIFNALCDLDHNGSSYIFEVSKYTPLMNSTAKLLAHPLQRPRQQEAAYKIGTVPVKPQTATEDKLT